MFLEAENLVLDEHQTFQAEAGGAVARWTAAQVGRLGWLPAPELLCLSEAVAATLDLACSPGSGQQLTAAVRASYPDIEVQFVLQDAQAESPPTHMVLFRRAGALSAGNAPHAAA